MDNGRARIQNVPEPEKFSGGGHLLKLGGRGVPLGVEGGVTFLA